MDREREIGCVVGKGGSCIGYQGAHRGQTDRQRGLYGRLGQGEEVYGSAGERGAYEGLWGRQTEKRAGWTRMPRFHSI